MFSDHFGIAFEFEPASVPSRILAYIMDRFLLFIFWLLTYLAMLYLAKIDTFTSLARLFEYIIPSNAGGSAGQVLLTLILLLCIIILYLFFFLPISLFEYFNKGRSPGKMIFGLRIENENGETPRFGQIILRALLRDIESLTGLVFIAATPYRQTFYDTLTGTVVVSYRIKNKQAAEPVTEKKIVHVAFPAEWHERLILWQRKYLTRIHHAPENNAVRGYIASISARELYSCCEGLRGRIITETGSDEYFMSESFLTELSEALDSGRVKWENR